MVGSIPSSFGQLGGQLTSLLLGKNNLSHKIPSQLGRLTGLIELDLGHNILPGSIPTTLGNLSMLTSLDLGTNHLTGVVPSELGQLDKLMVFRLDHNQLTGRLPSELANLPDFSSFVSLDFRYNEFTPYLPSGWDKLCFNQFWCECI